MRILQMELGADAYPIVIGKHTLEAAGRLFDLDRKVLIVTDTGVPRTYAETVVPLCREARIFTVPAGETAKSPEVLSELLAAMCDFEMGRKDCAVAVGGGVVSDLTGLGSALYMRGMDFYIIPTTVLSQVDASIGGKTAINFKGIKNIVGAFHQPKAVLIDPCVLATLPARQISNGLAESVKMALTSDAALFDRFERLTKAEILADLESIILASLEIKKQVVEQDEKETGLRRILNFGHTLGHGIEASAEDHGLLHGECVALGMIPLSAPSLRPRVEAVLRKLDLPTVYTGDMEQALALVIHDKKCSGGVISAITVSEPGTCAVESMTPAVFAARVREAGIDRPTDVSAHSRETGIGLTPERREHP